MYELGVRKVKVIMKQIISEGCKNNFLKLNTNKTKLGRNHITKLGRKSMCSRSQELKKYVL